jgi:multiple sugar transport system substrate-binding protein
MPGSDGRDVARRALTRRKFLQATVGTTGLLLLSACGGATQAPAKPAESKPAATTAPAAKPTEAAKPGAAAGAQPTTQAAPAAKTAASFKGTTLSVLQWTSFVPACDELFKTQVQEGFGAETGAQVNIEFVNANDLQPKTAASIQSGSGPDIIQLQHNQVHLYADNVVDVSDIAEQVSKDNAGEFYPQPTAYDRVGGKWLAVPHDIVGNAIHYRKDWFREAGAQQFPETFDELFAVGAKLKANGHPLGQALAHTFGDPPTWLYPMLWAYGGQEVDQGGKVAINSPETIAAVKAMKEAWGSAYDETGLAWDDSSNNRAFLAETISATLNGASIWWSARDQKAPFFDDIGLALIPKGPKGQFVSVLINSYAVMKYSKNVDAAKAFVRWSMSDDVWYPWFKLGSSFYSGVGPKQDASPIWKEFPEVTQVFQKVGPLARGVGYAGPADQKAGAALSKYIIIDMFARAAQGESPEQAVTWAENELKQIYT